MTNYTQTLFIIAVISIIIYLALVIYNTPPLKQIDTFIDTPAQTLEQPLEKLKSRQLKIRFVEPRTCYALINGTERYRMQSYNQVFEYWLPKLNLQLVNEDEPADIAIIGNGNSDNSALRPNEVNIFISIENVPHWNQYPHYSKFGDFNDPLIDIFVYNHKSEIEYLADQKISIPTILFRMNYFMNNYDNLKVSPSTPIKDRKFCLMVNKSGLNSKVGQFQDKLNAKLPVDHISLYENEIGKSSCYNPPELLQIFNQYKFIICFENSYTPGYITEKIFNCLFADTIPIYSGSPIIHNFINPDSFINIGENDNFDTAIDRIIQINSSEEEYSKYLSAPKISQKYIDSGINTEFLAKYYEAIDGKLKKNHRPKQVAVE